jgi:hypothetical protein
MPRETRQVRRGIVVPKIVEQEERIEIARFAEPEGSPQPDSCSLECRLGFYDSFDWSY